MEPGKGMELGEEMELGWGNGAGHGRWSHHGEWSWDGSREAAFGHEAATGKGRVEMEPCWGLQHSRMGDVHSLLHEIKAGHSWDLLLPDHMNLSHVQNKIQFVCLFPSA